MLIRRPPDIPESEVTDPAASAPSRRRFLAAAGAVTLANVALFDRLLGRRGRADRRGAALPAQRGPLSRLLGDEPLTPYEHVTSYNNYYEFSTGKYEPARRAGGLITRPWTLTIEGAVKKPQVLDLDRLCPASALEERVYRLRCVEAWSMVIPWIGVPLADIIRRVEPLSSARYVQFVSLYDPNQLPEQRREVLDWPYREGLRMDEALHPLTLLAVGLYGQVLPNQNGAPLRLVVPWKYGFKSAKAIVALRFTQFEPATSWTQAAPNEYGFYANVNPEVPHPRWSQARERRIGQVGQIGKIATLPFNGYAEQVAALYAGMDLRRSY